MDTELLKTAGQIAGIGGLALGTVILLFREIIRQAIFPKLTREQAFRLLHSIIFFVWSIGLAGLVAWVMTEIQPESKAEDGASIKAEHGIAAGRDLKIEGSKVNILTQPIEADSPTIKADERSNAKKD